MRLYVYKICGFLFCIVICIPYIVLGEDAIITIHDFLDSTVSHIANILNNKQFFDLNATTPLLEGYDRFSFPFSTPFELKALLFTIFPIYWAIVVNVVLVKVLAFWGMFLLLTEYLIPQKKVIAFIVSIIFALIPFYVDYGISSAGIPLISYALINLYKNKKVVLSFAMIILYAFYSTLALGGFFVCFFLFAAIVVLWYEDKKINKYLCFSLTILACFYLATNWSMIKGFFFPSDIISHRQEWTFSNSFIDIFKLLLLDVFSVSQYHAGAFIALPIVVGFLAVCLLYYRKYRESRYYLQSLIVLVVLISLGSFAKLLPFKIFVSFQFDRFYFLYPALCFVLLAKSLDILICEKKKMVALLFVFCSLGCVVIKNTFLISNWFAIVNRNIGTKSPTFRQFYDEALFDIIRKNLNIKKDYSAKVVSVGMFPSVAEYNGFWCLDAYNNSYPLEYKHKYRKIISKELDKDETLREYFDGWGSRCYIFSSDLGKRYLFCKDDNIVINHLDINTKELKNLGCEYILSAVDIKNYKDLKLSYVNSYTTETSFWNIRVYKLL